jgi:hypothetical protein
MIKWCGREGKGKEFKTSWRGSNAAQKKRKKCGEGNLVQGSHQAKIQEAERGINHNVGVRHNEKEREKEERDFARRVGSNKTKKKLISTLQNVEVRRTNKSNEGDGDRGKNERRVHNKP